MTKALAPVIGQLENTGMGVNRTTSRTDNPIVLERLLLKLQMGVNESIRFMHMQPGFSRGSSIGPTGGTHLIYKNILVECKGALPIGV